MSGRALRKRPGSTTALGLGLLTGIAGARQRRQPAERNGRGFTRSRELCESDELDLKIISTGLSI
jgi:hypothetical protein